MFKDRFGVEFVQENLARSCHGVLRGLHFQIPPRAQGKFVQVIRGAVFDVAVDLRAGSETWGSWVGRALTEESGELLWIPPGFAHGYAVTGDSATVTYKVTAEYDPTLERGIRWDDPDIGIEWPIADPILSERDRGLPTLSEAKDLFE